ncbi:MAG: ABC transporter permease [Pyrinomonadaceae bacterium]|nr:ABC transporter permease [Pyrinomonadaceae bacterium]
MKEESSFIRTYIFPLGVALAFIALWGTLSALHLFPKSAFPSPMDVLVGFREEIVSGRLWNDLVASLFRVSMGFVLAVVLSVPLGLLLGHAASAREALLPAVNFFRSLSPLAWIPFAILWFGVGDLPVVFLIFMATFFSLVLAVMAAVANIPSVFFRVAADYGFRGWSLLWNVTLPAIMPQIITALRVTAGVAWLVVVAAEMIAGRDGLGFAIWDARNGLRTDLLVCGMIVIGIIGVLLDRLLVRLTHLPNVRWGYER